MIQIIIFVKKIKMLKTLKSDFSAGVVVFFVALPLCLGIALASGAPLFSGLIAGIIGGVVVGAISGSPYGVSGPAAGLTVIVLSAINSLGYESFLLAVVLAGVLQLILGFIKSGSITYFFPGSVIKGMLSAIGIIIILKQIPHFFGYDGDPEGDLGFVQADGQNSFSELINMVDYISYPSFFIGLFSLFILIFASFQKFKKWKLFTIFPPALLVVIIGSIYSVVFVNDISMSINPEHLVNVPTPENLNSFLGQFTTPDFSKILNYEIWITAFTIAIVASLETLLCLNATDKLAPGKKVTPPNRELIAQGTGNFFSGLIGGIPVTQVIVRSSANIQAGAKSKVSAIYHGFLLILSVVFIPDLLNKIPLSVLAAILLIVGYNLVRPKEIMKILNSGMQYYLPFIITVLCIVFTDLLTGIFIGFLSALIINPIKSLNNAFQINKDNSNNLTEFVFNKHLVFYHKKNILNAFGDVQSNSKLVLNLENTVFVGYDIKELIDELKEKSEDKSIALSIVKNESLDLSY